MTTASPITLPGYQQVYSGKVRDLYAPLDESGNPRSDQLLLVASDRISAYDHVLDSGIPGKGAVLTALSLWWFEQMTDLVAHHVLSTDVPSQVAGRAVLVERLPMLPVECVARAYLTGGGLQEYRQSAMVSGVRLPEGLTDGSPLPEPIFTPSTKAPVGQHDEPISREQVAELLGAARTQELAELTVNILRRGNEIARERGIIIADTKVEFGTRADGTLVLADELLTPDSSRFWLAEEWLPGRRQQSLDKQSVRDWLTSAASGWDRSGDQPPPPLPDEVIEKTARTYRDVFTRLTGRELP